MAVNKCVKYLLFLFNLLFWISGCLILGVAIYLRVTQGGNKITADALPGINLMIAIGAIIMVLGFLGCCGAIKENRCLLMLFFVGLLIIFILLLAAGILGAVAAGKSKSVLTEYFQGLIPLSSQPADVQDNMQDVQKQLHCCGLINGAQDWGSTVPDSCNCVNSTNCSNYNGKNVYATPCIENIITLVKSSLTILLGIAFAIALLMILGMAFSMTLYCQIRKEGMGSA